MPPWADLAPRQLLALFLGSHTHGDKKVRKKISSMCNAYRDPLKCALNKYDHSSLLLKYQSTFCLEPAGDSPYRRSITDSIALGCIPVFFSGPQEDAYSWLWGDWRRAASVRVNRTSFLRGEIDIYRLLSSVPSELLSLMRRTLAAYARKFTLSTSDDPGDALHALLHGAKALSQMIPLQPMPPERDTLPGQVPSEKAHSVTPLGKRHVPG